jgi:hypothetical protein
MPAPRQHTSAYVSIRQHHTERQQHVKRERAEDEVHACAGMLA